MLYYNDILSKISNDEYVIKEKIPNFLILKFFVNYSRIILISVFHWIIQIQILSFILKLVMQLLIALFLILC